jgi:hypothetical protein
MALELIRHPLPVLILLQDRHQVLSTGEEVDVRLRGRGIQVLRQALVGLADDGGKREIPAEPKGPLPAPES